MNDLFWFVLMDLAGCLLIALLLTALTRSDRRSSDNESPGKLFPPAHRRGGTAARPT
ncbi:MULTISPECIES: hypothetical protein [Hydrocarboniphaga]|jgi:hypothetical protein|uniref:Uncharacterized protein n=1 Tax=Hydrocarboniphaga effusa AP103 TaxID=1172194 RepID=I8T741_9GAMM|nr:MULTISPECIES: hypothetical protein [Hydrocarboniphaga]EIT69533.1 hypothetical protein WQQ_31150 [Hydrocarboniphaga effusa AP103]MDZ4080795.1 hypothetical protein [Hydrocarboniphaga sp.]MDZ4080894.1 hypothetical protein [Hydrocarboniphaga sp.]